LKYIRIIAAFLLSCIPDAALFIVNYYFANNNNFINFCILASFIIKRLPPAIFTTILRVYLLSKNREAEPVQELSSVEGKSVAVFITVFSEPISIVEETVISAKNIDWENKQIYLLDDAPRDDFKELAFKHQINYLRRADRSHAKAGNLNNALKVTHSDYIFFMDADTLVHPNVIKRAIVHLTGNNWLVQFFQDSRKPLGLIFPKDAVTSKDWSENKFFFKRIMRAMNKVGAAIWCGAGALARRDILEKEGGIVQYSLTEDSATAKELYLKGYKTVYINEPLVQVLEPFDFISYRSQRQRWCVGSVQIFKRLALKLVRSKSIDLSTKTLLLLDLAYPIESLLRSITLVLTPLSFVFSGETFSTNILFVIISFFGLPYGFVISTLFMRMVTFGRPYPTMVYSHLNNAIWSEGIVLHLFKKAQQRKTAFIVTSKVLERRNNVIPFFKTCLHELMITWAIALAVSLFIKVDFCSLGILTFGGLVLIILTIRIVPLNALTFKRK
jgi:cellulose synthase (UDP-forming)